MAHARIIRQNFFNDPLIAQKYTLDKRYFLIGLACAADDFGRFWYNAANIKSIIFPIDEFITNDWINKTLKVFKDDFILCQYDVKGILYGHFPKWFDKGWYLKQKVDHPREFQSPDCPICQTESKKRETSRLIKTNSIKTKKNKENNNKTEENIKEQLTTYSFFSRLINKYPMITKDKYIEHVNTYVKWVLRVRAFDRNHRREFEGRLMGEQDKLKS